MQREDARNVLVSALWLAKERVVGELDDKEVARERLSDLVIRMREGAESPPTAADLADVLDDSDPEVKEAVAAWSQEDAPGGPRGVPLPSRSQAGPPEPGTQR